MGKKGRKKPGATPKTSSGLTHQFKANQAIRKLKMKIARWERNQSDPMKVAQGASRNNWDTSKMKAHLKVLEKTKAKPAKRP